MRRRRWRLPPSAWAAYPSKPVTMLVPFAAGGGGDILTRVIADHARNKRGIPVGVEYRPGAGATIAPSQVARAEPDGATLGLYSVSPFLTVPHLQKLSYDTTKDFTFIAIYAFIPIAMYVPVESPLKDWAGVLRFAKDNPGRLRWGTSGVRGVAHIAVEAAFKKEGVKTTFVPFTGGAEAITAMLGGHIEAVVSADYGPQLAAGKVRLLVADRHREAQPISRPADLQGARLPAVDRGDLRHLRAGEAAIRGGGVLGGRRQGDDGNGGVPRRAEDRQRRTDLHEQLRVHANVLENYRKLGEAIDALGLKSK